MWVRPFWVRGDALLLALSLAACGAEDSKKVPSIVAPQAAKVDSVEPFRDVDPAQEIVWRKAPHRPSQMGAATRPQLVLLSAPWCQWCRVLEHEILPDSEVQTALAKFETMHVDVDADPNWMDIPGFQGLPALAFHDARGQLVLTRSGYRPKGEILLLFEAVLHTIDEGKFEPFPPAPTPERMAEVGVTAAKATSLLEAWERAVYLAVNSNDGGFLTPARHPYPQTLAELDRWQGSTRPARVSSWIDMTMAGVFRGISPRLASEPLRDMDFGGAELARISRMGPDAGPRWRAGIERLPDADPYRGLQDPIDGGVFRYAAGPGWYHPHFERRAVDNLEWILLLEARGRVEEASRVRDFVTSTFSSSGLIAASQRSDPFYYRLREKERDGLKAPPVVPQFNLAVQAKAARVFPDRCELLLRTSTDTWPRAAWTPQGEDRDSGEASVDAVGELLLALASCEGEAFRRHAEATANLVQGRWEDEGLSPNPRLFRLAAGVCAARPGECARALASVESLDFSLEYPPPFAFVAAHAQG
jgi:hypothetical protein